VHRRVTHPQPQGVGLLGVKCGPEHGLPQPLEGTVQPRQAPPPLGDQAPRV